MSWILEDNVLMNRSLEALGAQPLQDVPDLRMELKNMRLTTTVVTRRKTRTGSNDLFEKCRNFTRPAELQAAGLYMYFEVFGEREGCAPGEVRMGERKVLMFGSNDYLDLINHPKVKEAAPQRDLRKYGSGCSGSRLLNGTLDLHVKLEAELAAFVHKEAAIIFGTGFQANYATLSALTEKGDVLVCDHNLHASLVEGALRSPGAHRAVPPQRPGTPGALPGKCPAGRQDPDGLRGRLQHGRRHRRPARRWCGWPSPTARAPTSTRRTASACWAPPGAGAAEHLGVLDDVDIVMGTFSKSLASVGGFVASSADVIDYLKHTARPFVFSASLPAASVAAAGAALEIMRNEPERRRRLLSVADLLRHELRLAGFRVLDGETAIVPVVIQNEIDLCRLCKALLEEGIYINPVLRPAGVAEPAADLLHRRPHREARGAPGGHAGPGVQAARDRRRSW